VRVAAMAYGPVLDEQWGMAARQVDFFDVKADFEALLAPRRASFVAAKHPALHPGRSGRIELDGRPAGWIGELHPRLQQKYQLPQAPVVFEVDAGVLQTNVVPTYAEVSKFQPVRRDLAIVVDESLPIDTVLETLASGLPGVVSEVALFDVYRGIGVEEGKKSLAFRVVMQDTEKTLTDQQVDAAMQQITEMLTSRLHAKLRS
jgi:phenylalanyl-tRNA synthetase beta chain